MNRKLLFFDIDGTLLAGGVHGYIPENVITAMKQAQENGHYLFINSGRTFGFLPQIVYEFPFDGYVCGCGTEIVLHGESLYHHKIPDAIRFGMGDLLRECGIMGCYEGPHHTFFDTEAISNPAMNNLYEMYRKINGDEKIRDFDDPELDYDKFVIFYTKDSKIELFKEKICDTFTFIPREHFGEFFFAEIVPKNCSKATGIDFLCEHLGLSLDDCYAFGDSTNDLTMLEHVPYSIGMGNSMEEVLEKVSYITTPVDRDGIVVAMKHYGLV